MINTNKIETTERTECSADTKLFFDDVYTNSTRTKKAQVETMQYGRSMIEMLGVLAIVGVLSVGGIAGYSKAMMQFKINKAIEEISQIVTNVRTLYSQQTTYEGIGSSSLQSTIYPEHMIQNNRVKNVFNGTEVWLQAGGYLPYLSPTKVWDNNYFMLTYGPIPYEACVALGTQDWGGPSESGLVGIQIGATSYGDASLHAIIDENPNQIPLSVAQVSAKCKEGYDVAGNNHIRILLVYK